MSKIKVNWQVVVNAICTLITTIIGALAVTSCTLQAWS